MILEFSLNEYTSSISGINEVEAQFYSRFDDHIASSADHVTYTSWHQSCVSTIYRKPFTLILVSLYNLPDLSLFDLWYLNFQWEERTNDSQGKSRKNNQIRFKIFPKAV